MIQNSLSLVHVAIMVKKKFSVILLSLVFIFSLANCCFSHTVWTQFNLYLLQKANNHSICCKCLHVESYVSYTPVIQFHTIICTLGLLANSKQTIFPVLKRYPQDPGQFRHCVQGSNRISHRVSSQSEHSAHLISTRPVTCFERLSLSLFLRGSNKIHTERNIR